MDAEGGTNGWLELQASSSVEVRLDPDEPDRQAIPWGLWMNNLALEFLVEIVRGDLWTFFGLLVHTPTSSLSLEPCPTFMPIESHIYTLTHTSNTPHVLVATHKPKYTSCFNCRTIQSSLPAIFCDSPSPGSPPRTGWFQCVIRTQTIHFASRKH
jgi:hypothetical protein